MSVCVHGRSIKMRKIKKRGEERERGREETGELVKLAGVAGRILNITGHRSGPDLANVESFYRYSVACSAANVKRPLYYIIHRERVILRDAECDYAKHRITVSSVSRSCIMFPFVLNWLFIRQNLSLCSRAYFFLRMPGFDITFVER